MSGQLEEAVGQKLEGDRPGRARAAVAALVAAIAAAIAVYKPLIS